MSDTDSSSLLRLSLNSYDLESEAKAKASTKTKKGTHSSWKKGAETKLKGQNENESQHGRDIPVSVISVLVENYRDDGTEVVQTEPESVEQVKSVLASKLRESNNNSYRYGGRGENGNSENNNDLEDKEEKFKNVELNEKFLEKMYRMSKIFVFCHSLVSCVGAAVYSVMSILATNEWRNGIETPGWHIPGGFTANVILANMLAVAVNINLCFSALLVLGFHRKNRGLIWMWYVGQVVTEGVVTVILIFSVTYDCKPTAILSIPPVIYYVVSLSFFRQILATLSYK